jgi:hypothetical protein
MGVATHRVPSLLDTFDHLIHPDSVTGRQTYKSLQLLVVELERILVDLRADVGLAPAR